MCVCVLHKLSKALNIHLSTSKSTQREQSDRVENLVDILIKREDEINVENCKNLEVPDNLLPKFKEMDKTFLKD